MCSGSEPAWYQDNFRQFGRLMTQRLVNLSHTSIAFVKGENCVASSTLLEGYEQCLYENKIPYDAARVLEVEGQLPEQISVGVSAFVCADPLSAQRVICRLTAAGFTVPGTHLLLPWPRMYLAPPMRYLWSGCPMTPMAWRWWTVSLPDAKTGTRDSRPRPCGGANQLGYAGAGLFGPEETGHRPGQHQRRYHPERQPAASDWQQRGES